MSNQNQELQQEEIEGEIIMIGRPMFCPQELADAACEYWISYNYCVAQSPRWKKAVTSSFFEMTEENLDDGSPY
tara:strand:+ start:91 stop:312 length:222 start_codon:yes stop_codon:yes gene_type:complete